MISVTPNAAGRESTVIGIKAGQPWPFDQAMASMMMVSANDAAYTIAETVGGGSIDGFAADLEPTAKRSACGTARSATPPASPTTRRTRADRR